MNAAISQLFLLAVVYAWDYEDIEDWGKEYFYCGGFHQSPINIDTSTVGRNSFAPVVYKEFPATYNISNNGDTIIVRYNGVGQIEGAHNNVGETYLVDQFHFHWGLNNDKGSEHSVNGKFMPMEMHVVTHNSKYPSFDVAKLNRNGIAVLAFFFKIVNEKNEGLQKIVDMLPKLKVHNKEYPLEDFHLSDIIPLRMDNFFRYAGSLTTPPCYETVQWTVFEMALGIDNNQMQAFRKVTNLEDDDKELIAPNYRPVQPLNGRYVMQNAN